ncbi:MAG: hypothetical protein OEM48_06115 [Gammaproteobacteria bacterium]|nr:hypothetical protein [Gammaproteobacteria bacterium]MDH3370748.1 hypothetical protein [Gammaproteobacteria bacterium]MDH3406498.1 hypothetical protein [Gammaproteobacteria bacterium]MDH3562513.1 hypothetical protein [Gammaproteobacteria bacterium]MDH5487302.1 hypothetical protein [Gammaproteobacteria bacterium]
MKYLKDETFTTDMDSAEDTQESSVLLEAQLAEFRRQMLELPPNYDPMARADLLLQIGRTLIRLEKNEDAWDAGREAFDIYVARDAWEGAVQACDIMFLSEQPESLAALGQGIWLTVTFPMDPELSVAMLQHVVDETPAESDGAAVAATVAHYLVDLRAEGRSREDLMFYTNQLLATVARRHSDVHNQVAFSQWFKKLELDDPAKFLPRLRNVVDVLVQEHWWIDRDAIREKLPVN